MPEIQALRAHLPGGEAALQLGQQLSRGRRGHLVLDHYVRLKSLPVLPGETFRENLREQGVQPVELRRGESVGDTPAQRAKPRDLKIEDAGLPRDAFHLRACPGLRG